MRVLLSGGAKTQNIIDQIKQKFESSGDDMFVVKYIEDIEQIFSVGDYFDKAIIVDQSITHDFEQQDEDVIRQKLNRFANSSAMRNRNESYIFLTGYDEIANMIYEETIEIQSSSAIVVKVGPYSVRFFASLITADLNQIPESFLFQVPEVGATAAHTETTESDIEDNELETENDTYHPVIVKDFDNINEDTIGQNYRVNDEFKANLGQEIDLANPENTLLQQEGNSDEEFESSFDNEGAEFEPVFGNNFDTEGFDTEGFDTEGFDTEGFDTEGFDTEGFDTEGFDTEGFDTEGFDTEGFDTEGFDTEGFGKMEYSGDTTEKTWSDEEIPDQSFIDNNDAVSGDLENFLEPEQPEQEQWQPEQEQWQPEQEQWQPEQEQWQPEQEQWQPEQEQWQPEQPMEEQWQPEQPMEEQWQPEQPMEEQWQPEQPMEEQWQPEQPMEEQWQPEQEHINQNLGYDTYPNTDTMAAEAGLLAAGAIAGLSGFNNQQNNTQQLNSDADYFNNNNQENQPIQPNAGSVNPFNNDMYYNNEQIQNNQTIQPNNVNQNTNAFADDYYYQSDDTQSELLNNQSARGNVNIDNIKKQTRSIIQTVAARGNNICVTGCGGCGTSTVAFNIANTLANLGYNVLLVDFDTECRTQSYISKNAYNNMDKEGANLMAAVNGGQGVTAHTVTIANGFHLLTMGIAGDTAAPEDCLNKEKVSRFITLAKPTHHFVVYDVPFDSAVGFLSDVVYLSDNLLLVTEATTQGIMKMMLKVCNISTQDMQDTFFAKAQLIFNKYRGMHKLLGNKIKSPKDITRILDKTVIELVGQDNGVYFSSMHIAGILNDDPDYELGWFEKVQYSDTAKGIIAYCNLIQSIITHK